MPIYDQTFRRYDGPRNTRNLWIPVAMQTLRRAWKSKLTHMGYGVILIYVLMMSLGFYAASKVTQIAPAGQSEAALKGAVGQGLPMFGGSTTLSTVLFTFLMMSFGVTWFLMVCVGGASVSLEKRHAALPLFFSRPLGVWDYMIGKITGLAAVPAVGLSVALLIIYLQNIAYFHPVGDLIFQLPGLLAAFAFVLLLSLIMALVMAAISSCSKSAGSATAAFVGFWIGTRAIAFIVYRTSGYRNAGLLSLGRSLEVVMRHLLRPDISSMRQNRDFWEFGLVPSLVAIVCYCAFFLWLLRRNLKVVEVVK